MKSKISFLKDKDFIFLGGKGGVGKTTMAASLGILSAKNNIKTLVVSTDPAHSLSDVFGQPVGIGTPKSIEKQQHLFGQEIHADETMEDLGYLLSQQDLGVIDQVFTEDDTMSDYSPPGMDEIVALMKLVDLIEKQTEFDLVIFDTAPTGHTLNLLELPDVVDSWAYKMLSIQKKIGGLVDGIKGMFGSGDRRSKDPIDSIEKIREKIAIGKEKLTDKNATEFIPVTIPTKLSFWETDRLVRALMNNDIHTNHLIINQINPPITGCKFCEKRYAVQQTVIKKIENLFSNYYIFKSYLKAEEPQGINQLTKFAENVFLKD